jgi:hypothetical protein
MPIGLPFEACGVVLHVIFVSELYTSLATLCTVQFMVQSCPKMLRKEVEIYLHEDLHLIDEGEISEAKAITVFEWWKVREYPFFFLIKYLS